MSIVVKYLYFKIKNYAIHDKNYVQVFANTCIYVKCCFLIRVLFV